MPLWLLGRSTAPIWFVSDLTHGSPLLPGLPFLDPNDGFTSQALGHLVAWDWLHGVVPWWNEFTGIGMPLAGELQPGAFFLPFNLLLLLPEGLLWQQICMQIIAGLATYALLRELGLTRLAALMGGALFAVNGTIAWTPGPAAVYCSLPFLPLLLWGIERARKPESGAASILAIGVAIAWSILAGFPEPAYIGGLLALTWGLYRLATEPKRGAVARRATVGFALGMLVAAPLLIAFLDYLLQSDSFTIHKLGEESLPWAGFAATVMPYVYGPLTVNFHSQPLTHLWAVIGGYSGILVILLAVVGVTCKSAHRGLRFLLLTWTVVAWAKTFGVQPAKAIMNHLPLLSRTWFHRYSPPSWELALIILAAFGLDEFRNSTPVRRWAFGIAAGLLAVGVAVAWPQRAFWERPQTEAPLMFLLLGLSVAWALAELVAAGILWTLLHEERRRVALACLLVFDAGLMFLVPLSSGVRNGHVDTQAMRFLHDRQGLSRTYTFGPVQPNYGAYFRVASINHDVLPVPRLWADYADGNLLPGVRTRFSGVVFWPGLYDDGIGEQAFSRNLDNYLNLGVRYVITRPGRSPMPTAFLPMADASTQSAGSEAQALIKLKRLPGIFKRAHSVPGNVGNGVNRTGDKGPETPEAINVVLQSGQSAEMTVLAPHPAFSGLPITAVGTVVDSGSNTSNGELAVEICVETVCQSGQRTLSESTDHGVFQIPLAKPVAVAPGAPLRLTFRHLEGSQPVALRMASAAETGQRLTGPNGALPGHTLQLAFEYGSPLPELRKVYADSLMDIWELPNAAPYFQVIHGGPCTLLSTQREDVTAECSTAATLMRRELYMPGWRATINATTSAAVQQRGLFQSVGLPAGRSRARYHFAPPYVGFGWVASFVGMIGLAWQVIVLIRANNRRQHV